MRNKYVQLSLYDTYTDVLVKMENNKPEFIELLEEYIATSIRSYHIAFKKPITVTTGVNASILWKVSSVL